MRQPQLLTGSGQAGVAEVASSGLEWGWWRCGGAAAVLMTPHLASGGSSPSGGGCLADQPGLRKGPRHQVYAEQYGPAPPHHPSFLEAHLLPYLLLPTGESAAAEKFTSVCSSSRASHRRAAAAGSLPFPRGEDEGQALHRCDVWPGAWPGGCFLHLPRGEVEVGPQDTGSMGTTVSQDCHTCPPHFHLDPHLA